MSWMDKTKALISSYQKLDKYARYADLDDFLQWLDAEGQWEIATRIRGSEKDRDRCVNELTRWRKDSVSPWILFKYGGEYAASGTSLLDHHLSKGTEPPGMVVYFLYGRGIELFLKAFLVARGNAARDVREDYGHKLAKLLTEARRRKLGQFVPLNNSELRAVQLLSDTYSDKQLEYPTLGGLARPKYKIVQGVAQKMKVGLRDYCRKATE